MSTPPDKAASQPQAQTPCIWTHPHLGHPCRAPQTPSPEQRLARFVAAHQSSHDRYAVMVKAAGLRSDQQGPLLTMADLRALVQLHANAEGIS